MIHLGIIEDEPIMLASIEECFEASRDVRVELAVTSVERFLENIPAGNPLNTLLLDIMLPGMNGIVGIPRLLDRFPELDIIMLTNSDDSDNIFRALQAGAVGYISKKRINPNIIRDAVYTVHRGGSYMSPSIARQVVAFHNQQRKKSVDPADELTTRQLDIVQGLVDNLSYREIGERLDISIETVRDHIKNIYRKLRVNSKMEVVSKKLKGEI
ncbi:response regulator transcription factor [Neolewinella lacunae]|uniref:Response regulator transcription factor n=1 Tax=Neolewinella lacunae TaxID=1517758 RepID=A0A923T666_9BACT|nr:response regulator transcription factor [Neolewinella lacunae]MBC6993100.1 response regulator transcription factor [Neolewinella lacunae]MDN3635920.1 response regulator transcription factor [Neolewinella lacunae]